MIRSAEHPLKVYGITVHVHEACPPDTVFVYGQCPDCGGRRRRGGLLCRTCIGTGVVATRLQLESERPQTPVERPA